MDLYTEAGLNAAVHEASEAGEEIDTDVARAIASTWHDGQFSAFYAFASSGHFDRDDLSRELSRTIERGYFGASDADKLALDMLGTYILNYEVPVITSVWSSYGHRFIGDGDGYESCLTCSAAYELVARSDDPTSGDYVTASGGEPAECTGDTSMVHGYPGERACDACDDGCSHCNHDCPCILCDS